MFEEEGEVVEEGVEEACVWGEEADIGVEAGEEEGEDEGGRCNCAEGEETTLDRGTYCAVVSTVPFAWLITA